MNLEDISYDGILEGSQMKGGLGQLVDGLYGDDDYQKQLQGENSGKLFCCFSHCNTSTLKFKALRLLLRLIKKQGSFFIYFPKDKTVL